MNWKSNFWKPGTVKLCQILYIGLIWAQAYGHPSPFIIYNMIWYDMIWREREGPRLIVHVKIYIGAKMDIFGKNL